MYGIILFFFAYIYIYIFIYTCIPLESTKFFSLLLWVWFSPFPNPDPRNTPAVHTGSFRIDSESPTRGFLGQLIFDIVKMARWWFQRFFIFIPICVWKIPSLTHIFQMGWNHQLEWIHHHFNLTEVSQLQTFWPHSDKQTNLHYLALYKCFGNDEYFVGQMSSLNKLWYISWSQLNSWVTALVSYFLTEVWLLDCSYSCPFNKDC